MCCLLVEGLVSPNVGSAIDQPGEVQSEHVSGSHDKEGIAPSFAPTQGWHHHREDEASDNFKGQKVSEKFIQ